jgi:predicted RNA binding protein YcfA (HicA-like mRNA interferase family)
VNYREVAAKPRRLGCDELTRRSSGSHRKWRNPATGGATVVPDWGSKDLKIGTVRAAIRDLGIGWDDFNNA